MVSLKDIKGSWLLCGICLYSGSAWSEIKTFSHTIYIILKHSFNRIETFIMFLIKNRYQLILLNDEKG